MAKKKIGFGQFLVEKEIITPEQLQAAEEKQKETRERIGQILIAQGALQADSLMTLLSEFLQIPYIELKHFHFKPEITKQLSESYARYFHALVLDQRPEGLLVGMIDPTDIPAIDELKRILKQPIEVALIDERSFPTTLDLLYRHTEEIKTFAEKLEEEISGNIDLEAIAAETGQVDATVLKLLQSLFIDSIQANASDIHIEPDEKILRIRLRIDGVLHEQIVKEKAIAAPMALRLKLMGGLNITEKRLPQEGRFNVKIRDKLIDVRLSILPTQFGESVVMRLLDQSTHLLELNQIGMPEDILSRFIQLLSLPHGMVLVTGPTGSGKTTTLYGALTHLNVPERKIITVEDPVEYRIPRVNQAQVNNKLGLTFASISRIILRHDPNIIMVGEMRDEETANIGIRAALTGHLVLTTLHTNDAASSALRLLDMKVEGYLAASTLRGILSQRLVRRICDNCKETYPLTASEQSWLEAQFGPSEARSSFKHGKGCTYCHQTGYRGRIGVFELLILDKTMMEYLAKQEPSQFLDYALQSLKGKRLLDHGLFLAKQGTTTLSEVIRVAGEF